MRRALRTAASSPHLWVVAYLAYIGIRSLLALRSPGVMEHALPSWLTTAWMCALTAGGVLAVAGCLLQRTRVESSGLTLQTFGISLYAAIVAYETSINAGDYAAVVALVGVCVSRLWVLSRARRARRYARHAQGGA